MTKQSSIKYISGLLADPATIADTDQSSIAAFRQSFPYFVPVRYMDALFMHRKDAYSPRMRSAAKPYMGNWMMFCDFMDAGAAETPAAMADEQYLKQLLDDEAAVTEPLPVPQAVKLETAIQEATVPEALQPLPPPAAEPVADPLVAEAPAMVAQAMQLPVAQPTAATPPPDAQLPEAEGTTAGTQQAPPQPTDPFAGLMPTEDDMDNKVLDKKSVDVQPAIDVRDVQKEIDEQLAARIAKAAEELPVVPQAATAPEAIPPANTHWITDDTTPAAATLPEGAMGDIVPAGREEILEISINEAPDAVYAEDEEERTEGDKNELTAPDGGQGETDNEATVHAMTDVAEEEIAIEQVTPPPVTQAAAPQPEEKPADEKPLIRPVYTEDYFLQQGLKVSAGMPAQIEELKAPATASEVDKSLMVMMSFAEWLMHFKSSAERQKEETKDQRALKSMWQKEKLAAAMEEENEEIPENVFAMAVNSISREEGLASESLAEVYIKQEKYDKAIEMYRKLSLRNPQKNAYFARKIEEVLKEKRS